MIVGYLNVRNHGQCKPISSISMRDGIFPGYVGTLLVRFMQTTSLAPDKLFGVGSLFTMSCYRMMLHHRGRL